jgi:uncharacterized protein (DUF2141 family)
MAAGAAAVLGGVPTLAGPLAPQQPVVPVPVVEPQAPVRPPSGSGAIMGSVVAADSGQPVDDARLTLVGDSTHTTRTSATDDNGQFAFTDLPADRYTLSASKPGYMSVVYGQKNPGTGHPGTPVPLADGQQVKDLTVRLPTGGVIAGAVYDEKGRPAVAIPVRALLWTMRTGQRTLTMVGSGTSDDRGVYRIYGLAPGSYLVSAQPRNLPVGPNVAVMTNVNFGDGLVYVQTDSSGEPVAAPEDKPRTGYAPVYYPGTTDVGAASNVRLGVSEQAVGLDIHLERVPLSTITGQVQMPSGLASSGVQVRLVNTAMEVPGLGTTLARTRAGAFTFNNVTPGQYRVVATETLRPTMPPVRQQMTINGRVITMTAPAPVDRLWAEADVTVTGQDVSGLMLSLQPGMSVSGRVEFDGLEQAAGARRVRLTLSPAGGDTTPAGLTTTGVVADDNGQFTFKGIAPGTYHLGVSPGVPGWVARSAMANGRDVLDFPLEVEPNTDVSGLVVTLTNKLSGLSGTIEDPMGRPTADYTVVLLPADSRYWVPGARRIQATRPDTSGRFMFRDLPAGDYRLTAVTDVEPGQWFDPSFLKQVVGASIPVTLGQGETRTQDVRVTGGQED